MKELVEFITKSLVDKPDDVSITQIDGKNSMILELRVAPEDMGKIIGKQGRIAKALRAVVKAAAARERTKVTVEIVQ